MGLLDGKLGGVTALISTFGATVTLRWYTDASYDPATRTKTETEEANSPDSVSMTWFAPDATRLRQDGAVLPTDRLGYLDATGLSYGPEKGMTVEFTAGEKWLCVGAKPITTGGAVAAWEVVLRR